MKINESCQQSNLIIGYLAFCMKLLTQVLSENDLDNESATADHCMMTLYMEYTSLKFRFIYNY